MKQICTELKCDLRSSCTLAVENVKSVSGRYSSLLLKNSNERCQNYEPTSK